jgi:hypothetical protein
MADNKKAVDIYFNTSMFVDMFMNKRKGIFERPNGGQYIRIPLMYDESEGGAFDRSDPLSSDDKTNINAARFQWKHYYSNATIFETDELQNAGEYAEVQLVTQKLESAQKTVSKKIAKQIYSNNSDTAKDLTGAKALTGTTTSLAYGNIAEDDLVASDGSKPWKGRTTTTTEGVSLAVIRTAATAAKLYDGPNGKPDVGFTTEALFNIIKGVLQVQQRFTEDIDTAKAGFTNVVFEQMIIAPDDFVDSGDLYLFNSKFIGFAIHQKGLFVRKPWADLTVVGPLAKAMKILWHGNLVCSNRKAHIRHNNLS